MSTVLTKCFPQEKPIVANAAHRKKRVLIVGGGFAGIAAARALKRTDVEITLIDRRNHHIFQPLLYQVATAVLSPAEIAAPIRQLEAKQRKLAVLKRPLKCTASLCARRAPTRPPERNRRRRAAAAGRARGKCWRSRVAPRPARSLPSVRQPPPETAAFQGYRADRLS